MNPYTPPTSRIEPAMQPSNALTAVFVGAAVGNGVSYAVLFVCGLIYMWYLTAQGMPPNELYAHMLRSSPYLVFGHTIATLSLMPGGYWSARLSHASPHFNAMMAAAIVALLSICAFLMPYPVPLPFWSCVLSVLTPFAGYALGAHWWHRQVNLSNAGAT